MYSIIGPKRTKRNYSMNKDELYPSVLLGEASHTRVVSLIESRPTDQASDRAPCIPIH